MLDASYFQVSIGNRVWRPGNGFKVCHFGKNQLRLLAPAGPRIYARCSSRFVNIGMREMNRRNPAGYIDPTYARVVQFQSALQPGPLLRSTRITDTGLPVSVASMKGLRRFMAMDQF